MVTNAMQFSRIKTAFYPSLVLKLSSYKVTCNSVQRVQRDEVTDRVTFAYIPNIKKDFNKSVKIYNAANV